MYTRAAPQYPLMLNKYCFVLTAVNTFKRIAVVIQGQKGEMFFWNDFGYQGAKWNEKPSDTIQYKRRRAVEIPDIVQCGEFIKWNG